MEPHHEYLWSPLCESFTYIWIYFNIMPYSCHVFPFPRAKYFYSLLFTKMQVTLCVHAKSLQLCSTLQRYGLQPARLLCPWNSPGKNTDVGSHSLLQEIFLTQRLNWELLHCRQFLHIWATREALILLKHLNFIALGANNLVLYPPRFSVWSLQRRHMKGRWTGERTTSTTSLLFTFPEEWGRWGLG